MYFTLKKLAVCTEKGALKNVHHSVALHSTLQMPSQHLTAYSLNNWHTNNWHKIGKYAAFGNFVLWPLVGYSKEPFNWTQVQSLPCLVIQYVTPCLCWDLNDVTLMFDWSGLGRSLSMVWVFGSLSLLVFCVFGSLSLKDSKTNRPRDSNHELY